jgi:hypothetical protein
VRSLTLNPDTKLRVQIQVIGASTNEEVEALTSEVAE